MCVIAGYVGNRDAAPTLIEMFRREEGFWSGYYTGIATIDEHGMLHHAKVLGDLDELLRMTDAANLPGKIGIIHGRTPSGGDREWSHPYISNDNKLALVENGAIGVFAADYFDRVQCAYDLAVMLDSKGYTFSSRTPEPAPGRKMLPDGSHAALCDVQSKLIEYYMNEEYNDPMTALERAECVIPAEDVGVMIHADYPTRLFVARHNQPMTLGLADGEAFIATCPWAFPDDRDYHSIDLLPATASSIVSVKGIDSAHTFRNIPWKAEPLTAKIIAEGYEIVRNLAKSDDGVTFPKIAEALKSLFDGKRLMQNAPLGYMVVDALLRSGEATLEVKRVRGMNDALTAPEFWVKAK